MKVMHQKVSSFNRKAVISLWNSGANLSQYKIAKVVGISTARVNQIVKEKERLERMYHYTIQDLKREKLVLEGAKLQIQDSKEFIEELTIEAQKLKKQLDKFNEL